MDGKGPLRETAAWRALQKFYDANHEKINILQMFNEDSARASKFSIKLDTPCDGPFLVDFSKVSLQRKYYT